MSIRVPATASKGVHNPDLYEMLNENRHFIRHGTQNSLKKIAFCRFG
jgi:hypothetical protein